MRIAARLALGVSVVAGAGFSATACLSSADTPPPPVDAGAFDTGPIVEFDSGPHADAAHDVAQPDATPEASDDTGAVDTGAVDTGVEAAADTGTDAGPTFTTFYV